MVGVAREADQKEAASKVKGKRFQSRSKGVNCPCLLFDRSGFAIETKGPCSTATVADVSLSARRTRLGSAGEPGILNRSRCKDERGGKSGQASNVSRQRARETEEKAHPASSSSAQLLRLSKAPALPRSSARTLNNELSAGNCWPGREGAAEKRGIRMSGEVRHAGRESNSDVASPQQPPFSPPSSSFSHPPPHTHTH